jgi:hypothetical protein
MKVDILNKYLSIFKLCILCWKVNLFCTYLNLFKCHTIKAYVILEVQRHAFQHKIEMSGDIHAMAALPLQNEFPTCAYLIEGWVGTRPDIDTLKNRNFLPQFEIKPQFFNRTFHNPVTKVTELYHCQDS